MRRILLSEIQEGMVLAQPLYGSNGQIILNLGVEILADHISRLQALDVSFIYIQDDESKYIDINDVQAQQLYKKILADAQTAMSAISTGKTIDLKPAKDVALGILDELSRNKEIQPILQDIQNYDEKLYSHSVKGFCLAVALGNALEYEPYKLHDLGVGSIFRDIGMTKINPDIVNKPANLTPEETTIIRQHPEIGYNLLKGNSYISLASATCALQHHERVNGTGYPRNLVGETTHELAQISALTDVFSAMTTQTAYRNAIPVYDAFAIIQKSNSIYFDEKYIRLLAETVVPYPIDAIVRLNDNSMGTIVQHNDNNPLRPIVRISVDKNKIRCNVLTEINLTANPALYIAEVM